MAHARHDDTTKRQGGAGVVDEMTISLVNYPA